MKKFLLRPLWIIGFFLIHLQGVAQGNVVTGTVVASSDKMPMPGVSVTLKGQSSGTVTDAEGKFSINASSSQ